MNDMAVRRNKANCNVETKVMAPYKRWSWCVAAVAELHYWTIWRTPCLQGTLAVVLYSRRCSFVVFSSPWALPCMEFCGCPYMLLIGVPQHASTKCWWSLVGIFKLDYENIYTLLNIHVYTYHEVGKENIDMMIVTIVYWKNVKWKCYILQFYRFNIIF